MITIFGIGGAICGAVGAVMTFRGEDAAAMFGGLWFSFAMFYCFAFANIKGWVHRHPAARLRLGGAFIWFSPLVVYVVALVTVGIAVGNSPPAADLDAVTTPLEQVALYILPALSAAIMLSLSIWAATLKWDWHVFQLLSLLAIGLVVGTGGLCERRMGELWRGAGMEPYRPCVAIAFFLGQMLCGSLFGYAAIRADYRARGQNAGGADVVL